MIAIVQLSIEGVMVGLVYGLVAISFVVIYRASRIVNLAQGEVLVFGALILWTFTLGAGGGTLTVTDAFSIGDAFNVFDFGVLIGMTPSVATGGSCGDNPVPCFANPLVSHGVFSLLAGAHSITIQSRVAPFGAGAAYFRTDQNQNVVPEPMSMVLLGTGLLGAFGVVRRQRKMKR